MTNIVRFDSTPTAVVTGANSGIGYALVRELRARGAGPVVATYRARARSHELLKWAHQDRAVIALPLDVTSDESVLGFAAACRTVVSGIDVIVNNAGIPASTGTILDASIGDLVVQTQTHAIGPVRVTQALLPLVRRGAIVANISSMLGSIETVGHCYTHYAPAKTFQNALSRQLGACLRQYDVDLIVIHPGWVATNIGGQHAPLSPETSARGIVKLLLSPSRMHNEFVDYEGRPIPW